MQQGRFHSVITTTSFLRRSWHTLASDTWRTALNSGSKTKMRGGKRGRYTLEFKQEAARPIESAQSTAAAARSLGVIEQTLGN
jgi:hypothetical protein